MTETKKDAPAQGAPRVDLATSIVPADLTEDQTRALKVAHLLVDAGVPVFSAPRNNSVPQDARMPFHLPSGWENIRPGQGHGYIERWRPGMALAAVCGHEFDVLDTDLQNGGHIARAELEAAGLWPESFGTQRTASGGTHDLIIRTHLKKMPLPGGIDLQAGLDNGNGRGFVFIAPTVKYSKTTGEMTEYRWEVEPDMEALAAAAPSETHRKFLIHVTKPKGQQKAAPAPAKPAAPAAEDFWDAANADTWTWQQAEADIERSLKAIQAAGRGEVNTTVGGLARRIGRFVTGGYLTEDEAYGAIVKAVERGGVHSDEWNVANNSGWTLSTLLGAAFANAQEDGPFVVTNKPELDRSTMTEKEKAAWEDSARHFPQVYADAAILSARETASAQVSAKDTLRARLLDMDGLRNMPAAKPLIKGVLDMDTESWLIGQAGGFKSFVAIDWACHVATGREWRGAKVEQGKVLYVVAEGVRGFKKRVAAWEKFHGVSPDALAVLPVAVQAAGDSRTRTGPMWEALVEIVREDGYSMVVLDTQARMTVGLEENSATEMGLWIKAVSEVKEASQACVLVVHHTGRNGGDARGSSAVDAAQDMEWKVERKAHELAAVLKCEKSKDGDDRGRYALTLKAIPVGHDESGQEITSLVLDADADAFAEAAMDAVEITREEAGSLSTQGWIERVLEAVDVEGSGITSAALFGFVNDHRVREGQDKLKNSTFTGALTRMVKAQAVFKPSAGRYTTVPPEGAETAWDEA